MMQALKIMDGTNMAELPVFANFTCSWNVHLKDEIYPYTRLGVVAGTF
jgi:hypothetical protein